MDKYKHLVKNMGFLTISQFSTKILSFLMVPLYTSILTTEEYGKYDLYNTVVYLLVPVLTLNIAEALMRFPMDGREDPKDIFSVGLSVILKGFIIFITVFIIIYHYNILNLRDQYSGCLILMYFTTVLYNTFSLFARGLDKVHVMAVAGVINTFFMLLFNIVFLVYMKIGLFGYFFSHVIGMSIASFYLFIVLRLHRYISFKGDRKKLQKRMLIYTVPLVVSSISWYINSSLDRVIIVGLYGIAANGIYSMASKIPGIIQMLQNVFSQAWILSATKFYDNHDRSGFFSYTYVTYQFFLLMGCSAVIVCTRGLAKFFYAADFYQAWIYVPFLCLAVVFTALSGYVGALFTAVKNSHMLGLSTIVATIVNGVLNYQLAIRYGVIGAAAATMVSYYVMWLIRICCIRRQLIFRVHLVRDHMAYLILLIQSFLIISFRVGWKIYLWEGLLFILLPVLYCSEIKKIVGMLKNVR